MKKRIVLSKKLTKEQLELVRGGGDQDKKQLEKQLDGIGTSPSADGIGTSPSGG